MKKRIKGIALRLFTLAGLAALALLFCLLHNTSNAALAPTSTGVWKLDGYRKPVQVWSWETENRAVAYSDTMWRIVDGRKVYDSSENLTKWEYRNSISNPDWSMGAKAFLAPDHFQQTFYVKKDQGLSMTVDGTEVPLRRVVILSRGRVKTRQVPIWPDADPCAWTAGNSVYSVAPVGKTLRVFAAWGVGSNNCSVLDHVELLPYTEDTFGCADTDGYFNVLQPQDDGSLARWTLQVKDANQHTRELLYFWQQQPALTVADYPALARPYKLDLSQGRRELLYLDENGHLCIIALTPDAKPMVLDDTLTLTEADLERVERYGNAITFPLPDGNTRVWFPRSNLFGMTKWLTWDLP